MTDRTESAPSKRSWLAGFGSRNADPLGFAIIITPVIAGAVSSCLALAFAGMGHDASAKSWFQIAIVLAQVVTTILIGFDAPRTRPQTLFRNPLMIAVGVACVWLINYPRYVYLRDRVAEPKRFRAAIIAMAVLFLAGPTGGICGAGVRAALGH